MATESCPPCALTGRRAEIAAAARALIAERGFEGLRTRDIAERVGINIATLHYHVPTKEALVALVAGSIRDDFIAQHESRPRQSLSALDKLRLEFADFRETMTENPALFTVWAELAERARRDERVDAVFRPLRDYWHAQISAILAEGRVDGAFRPDIDPHAMAAIVIGSMAGTRRHSDPSVAFFDRVAAELERAVTPCSRQD